MWVNLIYLFKCDKVRQRFKKSIFYTFNKLNPTKELKYYWTTHLVKITSKLWQLVFLSAFSDSTPFMKTPVSNISRLMLLLDATCLEWSVSVWLSSRNHSLKFLCACRSTSNYFHQKVMFWGVFVFLLVCLPVLVCDNSKSNGQIFLIFMRVLTDQMKK